MLPLFEDALEKVAKQAGMTPLELMQEAMRLRLSCEPERVELEPSEEYIEQACLISELERIDCKIEDIKK